MTTIVITGRQHASLKAHLFPGDDLEAAAVVSCRVHTRRGKTRLLTRHVDLVPYERCRRLPWLLEWESAWLHPILQRAEDEGLVLVKFHSHPGAWLDFSEQDDRSDRDLFPGFHHYLDRGPHGSVVVVPSGRMTARTVDAQGEFADAVVQVVGDSLEWHGEASAAEVRREADRFVRAFGEGTYRRMRTLRFGIVGCSGTGSLIIEQALRCMIGGLVLVEPKAVRLANLNRVPNSFPDDLGRPKTEIFDELAARLGFGTEVERFDCDLRDPDAVRALSSCDVLFGCMDSIDGRYLLNRIATFYMLPYFDLGANIDVNADGEVMEVSGAIHYLQPDGSSLLSRRVFSLEDVAAAMLLRDDPIEYAKQRAAGYVHGPVVETRPAVLPLNMRVASDAFLEFLSRIHAFRQDGNAGFARHGFSLCSDVDIRSADGAPCEVLMRHCGRGDVEPLLDLPRYG